MVFNIFLQDSAEFNREEIYAIDIYGFGTLIRNLMTSVNVDGKDFYSKKIIMKISKIITSYIELCKNFS